MNHLDATTQWVVYLSTLLRHGDDVRVGGIKNVWTKELQHAHVVYDMAEAYPWHPARRASKKFAAGEAHWILTGDDRVATIAPYNRRISDYSDDGERFFGAYGPRVRAQLAYVLTTLRADPSSRQAVINLWRDAPPRSKDLPCTTTLIFQIRRGKLDLHVFMRSSDAWLGVPYDWFNYAMLAALVVLELRPLELELGRCFWTTASGHLYEEHLEAAGKIMLPHEDAARPPRLELGLIAGPAHLLALLRDAADADRWPEWLS